jgi:hypothetical protein
MHVAMPRHPHVCSWCGSYLITDKFISSVLLMWSCIILISIRIDILPEVSAGVGVISYLSFHVVACGKG